MAARAQLARLLATLLVAVGMTLAAGALPAAAATNPCTQLGSTTLTYGTSGTAVVHTQACLTARGYPTNGSDGQFGVDTYQAVMAFQGDRGLPIDGVVGPVTRAALATAGQVVKPATCRSTDLICVSLSRRTAYLQQPGHAVFALHTSTGNGQWYTTSQGTSAHAVTPTGRFTVCRKIPGLHHSSSVDNGDMYWPMYFNYGGRCTGVALHGEPGYSGVPPYNASHGCARIGMAYIESIYGWVPIGARGSVVS
jgi:cell wall hydrolase